MARLLRWLLTPWFVLGLLLVVIVLAVLFTPVQPIGYSYPLLTTHSAAHGGAMALYHAADRLGWDVERLERPMRHGTDSVAVYAVLGAPEPLTSSDVSTLLGAVSRGAGLLAVLTRNSALGDSLGVNVTRTRIERPVAPAGPLARARRAQEVGSAPGEPPLPGANIVLRFEGSRRAITRLLELPGAIDSSEVTTRDPSDTSRVPAVAAAFDYGRGRVVVVSDPSILRNVELRDTYAGVIAIRLLEAATPDGVARLVFDEYHFGYGQRSTFAGLVWRALFDTRLGRLTVTVAVAALVLLLAVAPRAIKPPPRASIERRSPLEHVGALARAYQTIGASQTAMRRLVRGLRRRHTPAGSSVPDDAYLEALVQRHPLVAGDVETVLRALRQPVTAAALSEAARALERVEHDVYPSSTLVRT
ncbi:MAG TPA: DUF4350 domain-containing protein [Gemmatimonadaceae bacterium]|nr:DUF4350 domain-containing protein [Gemmatimonadaceae bacterium]